MGDKQGRGLDTATDSNDDGAYDSVKHVVRVTRAKRTSHEEVSIDGRAFLAEQKQA